MTEPDEKSPRSVSVTARMEPSARQSELPHYRFEDLSKAKNAVVITINDAVYELRLTKSGKLVLNK